MACSYELTGGMWLPTESEHHINNLELLAAFFALQCFHSSFSGKRVKIMIDNTSAVSQINNMGICHSEECNSLVVQIWEFCISNNFLQSLKKLYEGDSEPP